MIRGLYTAASGMNAELARQDVVSNNLANVNTTGFKKDEAVFKAFPTQLMQRIHDRMDKDRGELSTGMALAMPPHTTLGVSGSGAMHEANITNFSNGSVVRTDRPLDLALRGNALFTVERADGSTAYTRNGNFTLNSDKQLSTLNGELVLGTDNRALVLDGTNFVVDATGQILVDGRETGRLQLAAFDGERMRKVGDNLYVKGADALQAVGEEPAAAGNVEQGFLEQANVQVVEEMVRMISVMRAYEANQKTVQMQDETLSRLINDVGRAS